jgi:hypothetical protein
MLSHVTLHTHVTRRPHVTRHIHVQHVPEFAEDATAGAHDADVGVVVRGGGVLCLLSHTYTNIHKHIHRQEHAQTNTE